MNIINELTTKGILLTQVSTKKLGIDLNGDKQIQDNEVIPDTNGNGQQDESEVLDFIVHNVRLMPKIIFKEKALDQLGFALAKQGCHPLSAEGIYYLPHGYKYEPPTGVETPSVFFDKQGRITEIWFGPAAITIDALPVLGETQARAVYYNAEGSITGVTLSEFRDITLPRGYTALVSEIHFNPSENMIRVHLEKPCEIKVNGTDQTAKYIIEFDDNGNIIAAE